MRNLSSLVLLASLPLVACGAKVEGDAKAEGGVSSDAGVPGEDASHITPVDAAVPDRFVDNGGPVVQEWGTYTSVQASDGHTLGGVHHEDETLPLWVHRRNFVDRNNYYFEELPEEPLQQLETPVLYFWSEQARAVHVDVSFPEGVVGQWYPEAVSYAPALNGVTAVAGGTMSWDVKLDPALDPATFATVDPAEIWAPSRRVASTPLSITTEGGSEEREQFIFYRGLGKFDPPIRVLQRDGGTFQVQNLSPDDVSDTFVLRVADGAGQIVALGGIAAHGELNAAVPAATQSLDAYVAEAQHVLQAALEHSGLVTDVAKAMVDTWSRSWFRNPGLRILYLAPRAWTDGWLPTTITPAPSSFVRTLVGRIETMTPAEERALSADLASSAAAQATFDVTTLGRFAEPRLRRALESLSAPAEQAYAQGLIDTAHALP